MMSKFLSPLLSFLFVFFLHHCNLVFCIESEALALLTWRSSLKYPGNLTQMWSHNISSNPCRWDGITCNHAGSITEVSYDGSFDSIDGTLKKFNFSLLPNLASLEFENNFNLHGEIPEEIGRLRNLKHLFLGNNSLTGQFPMAILNLSYLLNLNLQQNELTGLIPAEIELLFNLVELHLSTNKFTAKIPTTLGNMSELESLDLSYNYLSGTIPKVFGPSVVVVILAGNRLSEIPVEVGNMTNLSYVDFSYNELHGKVPAAFITQLFPGAWLCLNDNQLTGFTTPSSLGSNNSQLQILDLSNNNFTGTIPSFICTGGALGEFRASNNKFDDLLPITLRNCTFLYHVDLGTNNIKADISRIFGKNPNLYYVDFSENHFYGRLPNNLAELKSLKFLFLQGNNISGELPQGFSKTQLEAVNFDNNNLTGAISSELTNLVTLNVLILSNNKFSSLPNIIAPSLSALHLRNNRIIGGFPFLPRSCPLLVTLDLGNNIFFGEIPAWIGYSFSFLKFLRLRSNRFNGRIPPTLSKLNNLQLLDLSNNNLTGPIPHNFSNMSFMAIQILNISYVQMNVSYMYQEEIDVIWKGKDWTFNATIALLTGIDLSCNSLSGEIPIGLMKLQGLHLLNLSRNHLNGMIPRNIGSLTWLEILDLSANHLSGTIPPSISQLTHLSMLNLSHNNLTGQIPLGSQIQTFNPSVFSDNDGLCGSPLPNNCSTHNSFIIEPVLSIGGDHKLEIVWIICSTILGFITGFWIYFCALIWKASLRFAIFSFVDELQGENF